MDVLSRRGGHLPARPGEYLAWTNVQSVNGRSGTRQCAATVDENLLAQRMVHPRLPVVREQPLLPKDALGDLLREVGAEHLQLVLLADALIPAAEQETGIVDVMVEMVVREEEVVHLRGEESRLYQLVGSRRPAIEHQQLFAELEHVGTAESGGCRCGRSGAQRVDFSHFLTIVALNRVLKRYCPGELRVSLYERLYNPMKDVPAIKAARS